MSKTLYRLNLNNYAIDTVLISRETPKYLYTVNRSGNCEIMHSKDSKYLMYFPTKESAVKGGLRALNIKLKMFNAEVKKIIKMKDLLTQQK